MIFDDPLAIPQINMNTIPQAPVSTARSDNEKEAFTEGFRFGWIAGTTDPTHFIIEPAAIERGSTAMFEQLYRVPWDGRDNRIIPLRAYVKAVLEAAYGNRQQ